MNKKLLSLYILCCVSSTLFAQDFLGLSTGNYAGVTGVLLQPASIVDSRHKFDINLISTDLRYSNNYLLVDRDAILKFNKNNFGNYQTFKSKYLSEASLGAGEKAFFNVANRTQLPSFMATVGKKSAIALSFQSRSMTQGRGITRELAQQAYNGFYFPPLNNVPIDASGLAVSSLNWIEAGLTYGTVLYSSDRHFLKGAFTAKYLGGVASLELGSKNFNFTVNSDSTFNLNSNNFRYNHNKNADYDQVFDKKYRPDDNAFGFDAGLVYEYRGNLKNNKYIKNDDEKSYLADRRDVNKYIFKIGASVLDAGMFTFQKPDNVNSFTTNTTNWDIANGNYNTIKAFDTALANRSTPIANDPRSYNMYLPGALSVQVDIKFVKGLFLNAMAYRPLKIGSEAGTRFNNYGYYTITPRYERRHFGLYLPYTFSDKNDITDYKENRLGATVRVGPVFVGSSNLGTMLFNKNLKAADVHIGFKIGITYGKPNKGSRFLEKLTADNTLPTAVMTRTTDDNDDETVKVEIPKKKATTTENKSKEKSEVFVDYNEGKVYSTDRDKNGQTVIINNNYYYGKNAADKNDRDRIGKRGQNVTRDSLAYYRDAFREMNEDNQRRMKVQNKRTTDSINKKKMQLDSLINRLQLLRENLDSASTADSISMQKIKKAKTKKASREETSMQKTVVIDSAADVSFVPAYDSATEKSMADNLDEENAAADTSKMIERKMKRASSKEAVKKKQSPQVKAEKENKDRKSNQYSELSDYSKSEQSATSTYSDNERTDALLNRYIDEANQLQRDINSLQRQMDEDRKSRISSAYPSTVVVRDNARNNDPYRIDTVYIRETNNITDTVFLTKTDTVRTAGLTKTEKVFVPVEKEKIVKEKVDYTAMPAETVLFSLGSSAVRTVYNTKLNYVANILSKNPQLKLSVTGHTDKTGSQKVNELLSYKRATAVKQYFLNKGINANRISTEAVASTEPVYTEETKPDASQNRRVVLQIVE